MATRFPHPHDAIVLGAQLRQLRVICGYSQQYVSERTSIERTQISKIENGKARTLNAHVQNLCKFWSIDPLAPAGIEATSAEGSLSARVAALNRHSPALGSALEAVLRALEQAANARMATDDQRAPRPE